MEEDDKKYFYKALADIARSVTSIFNGEHPKFMVFKNGDYTVISNSEMIKELVKFLNKNIKIVDDIFPKQFKCFKPDENLSAKLVFLSVNCNRDYTISCSTRFDVIENKLYVIKMLSCKKSKGLGFVMLKYDHIEDDATLGRFMYMNQSANYFLTKLGGVCDTKDDSSLLEIISGHGKAGGIMFTNRLFGMFDPVTSSAYESDDQPNELYVDANNYKMVQFDTIESVKKWVGTDGDRKCPFINYCQIKLISKYLLINKWINRILHPNFHFEFRYIHKNEKA